MNTVLHRGQKVTLEVVEGGDEPSYVLKGQHSHINVIPHTHRYERFRAGYDSATEPDLFLEAFFETEITDIFEALAERYPSR